MIHRALQLVFIGLILSTIHCTANKVNLKQFPSVDISNKEVKLKVYLPDSEKGIYRATRFDWSGIIGNAQYKGHEYFGYWKESHDPLFHEDLPGPVEGYIKPGLGYEEAETGGKFIRIGVGIIEKPDEAEYQMFGDYKILDNGQWRIDQGVDWISFLHEIKSDIGYGYKYKKTIRLKNNGFVIEHLLENTGSKPIETDQFNHNFFMIDKVQSGPPFNVSFPYSISTADDLKGYLEIEGKSLQFVKKINDDDVFVELKGYSKEADDHQITVVNSESGVGVRITVDKPLHRMAFWACKTTLCPENSVWLSVQPNESDSWVSDYTFFVN